MSETRARARACLRASCDAHTGTKKNDRSDSRERAMRACIYTRTHQQQHRNVESFDARVSSSSKLDIRNTGSKIMQVSILRLGIRDVSNGVIRVVARKWCASLSLSARVVDPKVALNF